MTSPAARAYLEALGLEVRLPDGRFLEDLFLRFQRRVACETLTRPAGDAAAFDAEAFAAAWPEDERGVVGEERALAFAWLAGELGFSCELVASVCSRPWERVERDEGRPGGGEGRDRGHRGFSSKVNEGAAHRSVVADLGGRRALADAGFPLPVLLPLEPPFEEIPSSFGTLRVADDAGGRRIRCDARGEVAELLRLEPLRHRSPPPLEEIRRPSPDAPSQHDAHAQFALRVLDDRVLYWAGGRMTILDAWSVLTYPLAGTERAALETLFALNLEGIDRIEAAAAAEPATLAVFHALALPPEEARRDLVLTDPPDSLVSSRRVEVLPAAEGTRLVSRAVLAEPVPPGGPGESVRKTLVFHLAMELLGAGGSGAGAGR